MPQRDVDRHPWMIAVDGDGPDFPDLSEVDVVRHYTRLSQWNFGVDTGMYPLGSCTMKYNPKTNERQAALPGFAGAHPLLPERALPGSLATDVRIWSDTLRRSPACLRSPCSRRPAPRAN